MRPGNDQASGSPVAVTRRRQKSLAARICSETWPLRPHRLGDRGAAITRIQIPVRCCRIGRRRGEPKHSKEGTTMVNGTGIYRTMGAGGKPSIAFVTDRSISFQIYERLYRDRDRKSTRLISSH